LKKDFNIRLFIILFLLVSLNCFTELTSDILVFAFLPIFMYTFILSNKEGKKLSVIALLLMCISFNTVSVQYPYPVYAYDELKESKVEVHKDYLLIPHSIKKVSSEVEINKNNITASVNGKNYSLDVKAIEIQDLSIKYNNNLYEDSLIKKQDCTVTVTYENNQIKDITDLCNISIKDNVISAKYFDNNIRLEVPVVKIQSIQFIPNGVQYENNTINGKFKLTYEDKTEKIVRVTYDTKQTLNTGTNPIPIQYNNNEYLVNVSAEKEPWDHKVLREHQKEIEGSDNVHISDTLIIAENKVSLKSSDYVYIAHIFTKNNNQVRVEASNSVSYDGRTESPFSLNERLNPVLLVNGGGFNISSNFMPSKWGSSIYLLNNRQVNSVKESSGYELFISDDGELFSKGGLSLSELEGVNSSLSFKDNPILQNGEKQTCDTYSYAPRSGIGMVHPGEYYVVVAGHSGYSNGLTIAELRDIFYDLGCAYAFNLDGGGSSTLIMNDKMLNSPAQSSVRNVINYICFYE